MKAQVVVFETAESVMDYAHGEGYRVACVYIPEKQLAFWEHKGDVKIIEARVPSGKKRRASNNEAIREIDIPDTLVQKLAEYLKLKRTTEEEVGNFCLLGCRGALEEYENRELRRRWAAARQLEVLMTKEESVEMWTIRDLAAKAKLPTEMVELALESSSALFRKTAMRDEFSRPMYALLKRKVTWRERFAGWKCRFS